jgi:uncharacterized membrane protein YphA (DoxX/SURF4 family)
MMATSTASEGSAPRLGFLPLAFLVLGRLVLGGIFIFAAYTKLHFDGQWHLRDYYFFFAMAIDSYHLLPLWAVEQAARILPWFEMLLGLMLVLGLWLRWTAAVTSALITVFVFAIIRAYLLHFEISCGCFGNNEPLTGWTIFRDGCFLALSLAVTWLAFVAHRRPARRG